MNKIQERFIEVRKKLRLSQSEMAVKAQVKQSQISQIETGARNITYGILVQLEDNLKINRKWLESGEGDMFIASVNNIINSEHNNNRDKKLGEPETEYRMREMKEVKSNQVPIYDVEFSAGIMTSLIENRDNHFPVGYLSIPEVNGCDAIIRAKGDSMADRINDGDWIGIKRMDLNEWFPMGYIYAIETEQAQIIKYIKQGATSDMLKIVSHNTFYEEEEIPRNIIKELWSVRTVLPFSKIETLI